MHFKERLAENRERAIAILRQMRRHWLLTSIGVVWGFIRLYQEYSDGFSQVTGIKAPALHDLGLWPQVMKVIDFLTSHEPLLVFLIIGVIWLAVYIVDVQRDQVKRDESTTKIIKGLSDELSRLSRTHVEMRDALANTALSQDVKAHLSLANSRIDAATQKLNELASLQSTYEQSNQRIMAQAMLANDKSSNVEAKLNRKIEDVHLNDLKNELERRIDQWFGAAGENTMQLQNEINDIRAKLEALRAASPEKEA